MATQKQLTLSSGKKVQLEEHSKSEMPLYYPEKIIRLKKKLQKIILMGG